jgi:hypothetical protein
MMVEPLEHRIAPASVSVTYVDVDLDVVKITFTGPGALAANLVGMTFVGGFDSGQLSQLTINNAAFDGANVTFAVTRKPGGDGLAHVGFLNATGVDLGTVTVKGDLGKIVAGDANLTDPGLVSLKARSMGTLGLVTQGGTGDLNSTITGRTGSLAVTNDFKDALFRTDGMGKLMIGHSLLGGIDAFQGEVFSTVDIGAVKIGGDVVGGLGNNTGLVQATTKIESVIILGSVIGSGGLFSGAVRAHNLGSIKITGDLAGGGGDDSGTVSCDDQGSIGNVMIGGSMIGGRGKDSGSLNGGESVQNGNANLSSVTVRGSVVGGAGEKSGNIFSFGEMNGSLRVDGDLIGGTGQLSGEVLVYGNIGNIRIGGSLIGGTNNATASCSILGNAGNIWIGGSIAGGSGFHSGALSVGDAGSIFVGGSVTGHSGEESGNLDGTNVGTVRILGNVTGGSGKHSGFISATTADGVFIGKNLVGGTEELSGTLSGHDIGKLFIGGSVVGGSAPAAVTLNGAGSIFFFGSVASVKIGGSIVAGSSGAGTMALCGALTAFQFGPIQIKGSLVGQSGTPVEIVAFGELPATGEDLAIASLTVGGGVAHTNIRAGFTVNTSFFTLDPANADASIGPVKVGRNWMASSIVAGAVDAGAPGFGLGDFLQTASDAPGLIARIASITIGGDVTGTIFTTDNYGFVAQQIDKVKIAGRAYVLTPGPTNDNLALPFVNDVHILEV